MELANLERICTENPTSPLFARLADAYLSVGRKEEARHILEVGLEMFPTYVTGSLVYAKYLLAEKQYAEAQNFLLHVSAFSSDYPGLRALLERCQQGLHGPAETESEHPAPAAVETAGSISTAEAEGMIGSSEEQSGLSDLSLSDVFPHLEESAQPETSEPVSVLSAAPVLEPVAIPEPEPVQEIEWPPPPPADQFENVTGSTYRDIPAIIEPIASVAIEPESVVANAGFQQPTVEDSFGGIPEVQQEPEQVFAPPQDIQTSMETERAYIEPEQVFNEPQQMITESEQGNDAFGIDSFGASPVEAATQEEPLAMPVVESEGVVISAEEITSEDWPPALPAMMAAMMENAEPQAEPLVEPVAEPRTELPAEPLSQLTADDVFGTGTELSDGFGAPQPEASSTGSPEASIEPIVENAFGESPAVPENSFESVGTPEPAPAAAPSSAPTAPISVQGGRIVSKTLAEIYTAQGVFEEAVLTYKLLKQQRPEESAIWDARIADLEKKIAAQGPK